MAWRGASDISKTGITSGYGLYFVAGRAGLRPDSDPVVKEIGRATHFSLS